MDIPFPEVRVTMRLVAMEPVAGRKHEYVKAYGFDVDDQEHRLCEVALSVDDANDIMLDAAPEMYQPLIDIVDRAIVYILCAAKVRLYQFRTPPEEAGA